MIPGKNFRTLEVPVSSTNGFEFALPLDEVLREAKKITAIESYPVSSMSVSPITGAPVINATVFAKSTITLQGTDSKDYVINLPLSRIHPASNNGQPLELNIPALNPTKCRIRVGDTSGLVLGQVWVIGFWYE